MPFVNFLDDDCGMRDIIMRRQDILSHYIGLAEDIMRGPSELSILERELMGAFVSGLNGCTFCFGAHSATAAQFGVDKDFFEVLMVDIDSSPLDDKLKPLFHYIKKLTENPTKMVQADADAVYAAGWSDNTLSDATFVCAHFAMANRMVEGHGINRALPDAYYKKCGENIFKHGYAGQS